MAGRVPAIHADAFRNKRHGKRMAPLLSVLQPHGVDARDERGHDAAASVRETEVKI
jgi:hypothetical protein